jgi:AraC-like DNA-binding protein
MDLATGCSELVTALATRPPRLVLGYRSRTRADWDIGWHDHEHLEIVFHHRGSGLSQATGGGLIPFAAGDVALHAPRVQHHQPGERDGEDWCLHLRLPCRWPTTLPGLVHLPGGTGFDQDAFAALTENPAAELPSAAALARDLRAGALLADALAAIGRRPRADAVADHAVRCQEILDRRFAGIGLIDDVAAELGLSPDRLRHLFTARFAMGPRAYLRQVRLRAAQRLLGATMLGLDEIANRCGIGNARQLCDLFRELIGTTPGAWRRLARRSPD